MWIKYLYGTHSNTAHCSIENAHVYVGWNEGCWFWSDSWPRSWGGFVGNHPDKFWDIYHWSSGNAAVLSRECDTNCQGKFRRTMFQRYVFFVSMLFEWVFSMRLLNRLHCTKVIVVKVPVKKSSRSWSKRIREFSSSPKKGKLLLIPSSLARYE